MNSLGDDLFLASKMGSSYLAISLEFACRVHHDQSSLGFGGFFEELGVRGSRYCLRNTGLNRPRRATVCRWTSQEIHIEHRRVFGW